MNYEIINVEEKDKDKLYKLLQYSLYDGSQYIDNDINDDCIFEYKWFENYFTDSDRDAYFIKDGDSFLGMVMVNENLKFNNTGKCIAEFLVLPKYRRNHIGKRVAYDIFEKFFFRLFFFLWPYFLLECESVFFCEKHFKKG